MSQVDWSKAPKWATRLMRPTRKWVNGKLIHVTGWDDLVWADDYVTATSVGRNEPFGMAVSCYEEVERRPVAVWNGQGLPPVGTVCEALSEKVTIVAHHFNGECAIYAESANSGLLYYGKPGDFRPIRTAEQIAAEERAAAIEELCAGMTNVELLRFWAERAYDRLGYRKQVAP